MKKLKNFGIGAVAVLAAIGIAQGASANVSTSIPIPAMPKHSEIKASVEARFASAGLNKSDKILPVDGGYLYGEAEEIPLKNGKSDESKGKKFNSKTDVKSITVAKAIAIEIKNVENGTGVGSLSPMNNIHKATSATVSSLSFKKSTEKIIPLGTTVPSAVWALGFSDLYISNSFSGSGWRFAGYLFTNSADGSYEYAAHEWSQLWQANVDSGNVGDLADAYNTFNTGASAGVGIYPNGSWTNVDPSDGNHFLTYITYNPIAGSGYVVQNNSHY